MGALSSGGSMSAARLAAIVALALFFYVLPTLVTWRRRHRNLRDMAKFNLFLGWTVVHWAVALRRAFGPRKRRTSDLEEHRRVPWWSLREP